LIHSVIFIFISLCIQCGRGAIQIAGKVLGVEDFNSN